MVRETGVWIFHLGHHIPTVSHGTQWRGDSDEQTESPSSWQKRAVSRFSFHSCWTYRLDHPRSFRQQIMPAEHERCLVKRTPSAHDRLLNLASALSSAESVQQVLEQSTDAAMDISGADCGWVCLEEEDTGAWGLAFRRGSCTEYLESVPDRSVKQLQAYLTGNPDFVSDFDGSNVPAFDNMMRQEGATAWEAIPLNNGQITIGCMVVASSSKGSISRPRRKALEIISWQTACALARVKAEEESRGLEQAHRSALDAQTELVCQHLSDGTLIFVNEAYCRFYGKTSADLVGTSFFRELDERDSEMVARQLSQLLPDSPDNVLEAQAVAASGDLRWLRWRQRAIFDKYGKAVKFQSTGRDITERVTILRALEESERRYRTLVEAAKDVIFTLDMDFRFTYASPSVTSVLGYHPRELYSMNALDTLTERSQERLVQAYEDVLAAETKNPPQALSRTEQIEQYHKDGHAVWIETTMTLLRDRDGSPNEILMISRDITDRRHIEQMKSTFVTTAAHQLRTPLTSILGFSELLLVRDDLTRDERDKFLAYIRQNAQGMSDIINDLLDISRIERGERMPLRHAVLELHEAIEETVALYRESSSVHHIEAVLPADRIEVFSDKYRITRLFRNLIDNALKYSPAGGLVRLTCESFPDHHLFSIADEGVGMDSEQAKRAFDPFYRVDGSDTAVSGTGLGLTVARNIVEAQGGRIWMESEKGRGTTVKFTLPMRPPKYCE